MKNKPNQLFFYFLLCCLSFTSVSIKAGIVDSLKQELKKAKEDTNRVRLLLTICGQNAEVTPNEIIDYATTALALSNKSNYWYGKVKSYIALSAGYMGISKYDVALENLQQALKICPEKEENLKPLSDIYNNLGNVYYYKGDYPLALENYIKAVKIYELKNFKLRAAGAYFNISSLYFEMSNHKMAAEYVLKAETIFEEKKDTGFMCRALSFLGEINFAAGEYDKSYTNYSKALRLSEKVKGKSDAAFSLIGLGNICLQKKRYTEAASNFQKGLVYAKESDAINYVASCLQKLGTVYSLMGKDKEAVVSLNEALKYAQEIGGTKLIRDIHYDLANLYKSEKDFAEAYAHLSAGSILNDSLFNEENSHNFSELSSKYENEKKEKEIALLNMNLIGKQKDQKLLTAELETRNTIIIATIIGAILLLLSALLVFNRRQLIQRNRHLGEINLQRERNTLAVVQAQENEQVRIAKDLHDGVGTYLSTLKLNLQLFEDAIPEKKSEEYKNTVGLIDTISVELRNIMKNLSNETLQEQGLIPAFEELTGRVNAIGATHFDFHTHGVTERLDAVIESSLYRIGQELITNCIKYAKAKHATLQLLADGKSVTLMLEDDGVGFGLENTKSNPADTGGMGIKNIHDRVGFIKGTVRFESGPDNGTTCIVEVPIS